MVDGIKTKPTPERQSEYRGGHAFGGYQKAVSDQNHAAEAELLEHERKAVPKNLHIEEWDFRKRKDGTRPSGKREVEVRRDRGKFSRKPQGAELASHFGIMTGAKIPPPAKTKGPRT